MAHDFYDEIIEQMHNVMQNMAIKKLAFRILLPLVAGAILNVSSWAASVGPSGYTNAFTTQPVVADWSTVTFAGAAADATTAAQIDTNVATLAAGGYHQPVECVQRQSAQRDRNCRLVYKWLCADSAHGRSPVCPDGHARQ